MNDAHERADSPTRVLDRLEQGIRERQLLVRHEVRDAGVDGRPEEAGCEACHERKADHGGGVRRERQRDEHRDSESVGGDHQRPPLEPVEQRPEQ